MSRYFDVDGCTVWNPANGMADRFVRRVERLERELGAPSGIAPVVADEHGIDAAVFAAFVASVLAHERARDVRHGDDGADSDIDTDADVAATLLVLAERSGLDAGEAARKPRWVRRAREAARRMTR